MFKQVSIFLSVLVILISSGHAQDLLPARTDIVYEISADSLYPKNIPQDLSISVSNVSNEQIDVFILRLADIDDVVWTVVSAELDTQPLWLIMSDTRPERNDILAWEYDQENKNLKLYPPDKNTAYELTIVLRLNLLKPQGIQARSGKELVLLAQSGGSLSRCSAKGPGNKLTFR